LCAGGKAIRHSIEHNRERSQKASTTKTRTVSGSQAIPDHEEEKCAALTMTKVTFVLAQVSSLASFFS
jgi:thymidylate synthase